MLSFPSSLIRLCARNCKSKINVQTCLIVSIVALVIIVLGVGIHLLLNAVSPQLLTKNWAMWAGANSPFIYALAQSDMNWILSLLSSTKGGVGVQVIRIVIGEV